MKPDIIQESKEKFKMYTSQNETPTTSSYAESTKYVADILSSMANGGMESNTPTFVPNFLVSSGTGLTPTLTPTTLATIEQSFMELNQGARDPTTQSGFVPPVVEPNNSNSADHSQDSFENSSSDPEWEPAPKKLHISTSKEGVDYIVTSNGPVNVTPQRKYTRRNKDEKLPPEEEERRRVRRERNKLAAAKCRQRRVDHTNELVEETEALMAVQSKLESEIQSLKQERDQLEFILQSHQPLCKVAAKAKVKAELGDNHRPESCHSPQPNNVAHSNHLHSQQLLHNHTNGSHTDNINSEALSNTRIGLSIAGKKIESNGNSNTFSSSSSNSQPAIPSTTSPSIASARPNSLPLIKRDRARMLSISSATGVSINTPTSGISITPSVLFCPDLDTIAEGSTGLTPITGLSCSSQVHNNTRTTSENTNGNSDNGTSPTLISL